MVYCIDCKHYYPTNHGDWCEHPSFATIVRSPITKTKVCRNTKNCIEINKLGECKLYKRKWWKIWV